MCLQEETGDSKKDWKPIPGYEGYYDVSSDGSVRAHPRSGEYKGRWGRANMNFPGGLKKQSKTTGGYRYVSMRLPDQPHKKMLVHRLVMLAFVGAPADGAQVNHIDGDKENNALVNLEYCTPIQNLRHCIDVLGKKRGESKASKLKESDIEVIRSDKRKLREIAKDYGVTLQAIWMVKKRKNWGHVQSANNHESQVGCNGPHGAKPHQIKAAAIARIGTERFEALENDNTPHKWTREELIGIKEQYRQKLKELRKSSDSA